MVYWCMNPGSSICGLREYRLCGWWIWWYQTHKTWQYFCSKKWYVPNSKPEFQGEGSHLRRRWNCELPTAVCKAASSVTLLFCLGLSLPCGCLLLSFAANSKPDSYFDIKNFSNYTSLTSVAMGTTSTVVLIGELMKQSEWDLGKEG